MHAWCQTIRAPAAGRNVAGPPLSKGASIDLVALLPISYRSSLASSPALNPTASASMRASAAMHASAPSERSRQVWIDLLAILTVTAIVSTIYGVRLTRQSLFGEETRWGSGAREMLA